MELEEGVVAVACLDSEDVREVILVIEDESVPREAWELVEEVIDDVDVGIVVEVDVVLCPPNSCDSFTADTVDDIVDKSSRMSKAVLQTLTAYNI